MGFKFNQNNEYKIECEKMQEIIANLEEYIKELMNEIENQASQNETL